MSANITDKFNKASAMDGSYPRVATIVSSRQAGAQVMQCDDLSTWADDTAVHFSTYQMNIDGSIDSATQTDWKGVVSGNNITNLTRIAGAADSGNAAGDRVELNPTIGWLDDIITGLLAAHKQDGTLKDGAVNTAVIVDAAITAAKLASNAVTTAKLADNAVETAKIKDKAVTAAKFADGAVPKFTLQTTDPGEGATLAANSFIAVY